MLILRPCKTRIQDETKSAIGPIRRRHELPRLGLPTATLDAARMVRFIEIIANPQWGYRKTDYLTLIGRETAKADVAHSLGKFHDTVIELEGVIGDSLTILDRNMFQVQVAFRPPPLQPPRSYPGKRLEEPLP